MDHLFHDAHILVLEGDSFAIHPAKNKQENKQERGPHNPMNHLAKSTNGHRDHQEIIVAATTRATLFRLAQMWSVKRTLTQRYHLLLSRH